MASKPHGIYNNQSAVNYINKKGIDELFEVEPLLQPFVLIFIFVLQAIMTALMVHKPDDHIAFIRECLDKVNLLQILFSHAVRCCFRYYLGAKQSTSCSLGFICDK